MERPHCQGNTPREAVTAASYVPPELVQSAAPRAAAAAAAAAAADARRPSSPSGAATRRCGRRSGEGAAIKLVQKGDGSTGGSGSARMRELVAAGS